MGNNNLKLSINNQEIAEAFFEETRLIGIMAPFTDYHFCWHLNHLLDIDFRMNNELEIRLKKKKREYYFSVFEYMEPTGSLSYYLYNNQDDGEYLLPELKHLDFLWLFKNDFINDHTLYQIINPVRSIDGVQLVIELTNEKIKNKEHLVF